MSRLIHPALFLLAMTILLSSMIVAEAEENQLTIMKKPEANVSTLMPQIKAAEPAIKTAWTVCGAGEPLITSANDGRHRLGSWHYKSLGLDLRSRGLNKKQIGCVLKEVLDRLPTAKGGKYVFIFEPDGKDRVQHFHLHFELFGA